jgi:preprotein translocase subunit SecA
MALTGERLKDEIFSMSRSFVQKIVTRHYEEADIKGLLDEVQRTFMVVMTIVPEKFHELGEEGLVDEIMKEVEETYKRKEEKYGTELIARIERFAMLSVIDDKWKEHLREMDDLKEGINFRAYGQKDPLIEYKKDGFELFVAMLDEISVEVINMVFKFTTREEQQTQQRHRAIPTQRMQAIHASAQGAGFHVTPEKAGTIGEDQPEQTKKMPVKVGPKIGRNDPCPCGSGKKYKNCHGK